MALATKFTIVNKSSGIVVTCTEVESGMYLAEWTQYGKQYSHTYSEAHIREDMNEGSLIDYKVATWLH